MIKETTYNEVVAIKLFSEYTKIYEIKVDNDKYFIHMEYNKCERLGKCLEFMNIILIIKINISVKYIFKFKMKFYNEHDEKNKGYYILLF